jgi:hypothetical protein
MACDGQSSMRIRVGCNPPELAAPATKGGLAATRSRMAARRGRLAAGSLGQLCMALRGHPGTMKTDAPAPPATAASGGRSPRATTPPRPTQVGALGDDATAAGCSVQWPGPWTQPMPWRGTLGMVGLAISHWLSASLAFRARRLDISGDLRILWQIRIDKLARSTPSGAPIYRRGIADGEHAATDSPRSCAGIFVCAHS